MIALLALLVLACSCTLSCFEYVSTSGLVESISVKSVIVARLIPARSGWSSAPIILDHATTPSFDTLTCLALRPLASLVPAIDHHSLQDLHSALPVSQLHDAVLFGHLGTVHRSSVDIDVAPSPPPAPAMHLPSLPTPTSAPKVTAVHYTGASKPTTDQASPSMASRQMARGLIRLFVTTLVEFARLPCRIILTISWHVMVILRASIWPQGLAVASKQLLAVEITPAPSASLSSRSAPHLQTLLCCLVAAFLAGCLSFQPYWRSMILSSIYDSLGLRVDHGAQINDEASLTTLQDEDDGHRADLQDMSIPSATSRRKRRAKQSKSQCLSGHLPSLADFALAEIVVYDRSAQGRELSMSEALDLFLLAWEESWRRFDLDNPQEEEEDDDVLPRSKSILP
ncbi:uncharacterized protein L969DRAFT_99023 [Mixia osmundae IAM 14324]|uniref:Uncharacterized protein n=1 Tax=Mixia osmundae (strain CBS 9802 / IAM 14324 / JCM 22182 / KY 12970) TaxID=764103 RepID=G7E0U8_MIXOS|nr:uncharacterized protein L969DRAFT_99023 [Mixia osmundae IAM 14324]KEI39488.1 hypothetical protein L969DRAFT_99023 [Mixia osmundae IAM 14324]GAA96458.1 hypothetical protein E5Q_03125 [Mixia osmundae IAM 14324]